ncbi:hypothetical protein AX16_005619 [Volvariella volvacea WC 439]|nr:hypothetical protein AX16_005619 [Volvariella volvacea WC 439]
MFLLRAARTISELSYALLILITIVATGLSCAALLSQAVRNSPSRSWRNNFNALIIGASYTIVLIASVLFCIKRRVAIRLRLHRISKSFSTIGRGDVPDTVHEYISQEYFRSCLVFHKSIPVGAFHPGWTIDDAGQPINFRREILSTIPKLDEMARIVIPTHPPLKPHARMLHHFRFIKPLLSTDEFGLTPLHYYDSVIQIARMSSKELSKEEYELGRNVAEEIATSLDAVRMAMEDEATRGSRTSSTFDEGA